MHTEKIRKGEIIHQRGMVELQFFHATHLRLLGDVYVQLFEYRWMHDKVTERKGILCIIQKRVISEKGR